MWGAILAAACGEPEAPRPLARTHASAIAGGREAGHGEHRAVVGVRSIASLGGGGMLCTGALLAPELVVTARHCVAATSGGGCGGRFGASFALESFAIVAHRDLTDPMREQVLGARELDPGSAEDDEPACASAGPGSRPGPLGWVGLVALGLMVARRKPRHQPGRVVGSDARVVICE